MFAPVARVRPAGAATASADAVAGPAERVRRALPAGLQWYWKADFVDELTDEAIERHVEYGASAADPAVDDAPVPDRRRGRPTSAQDATAFRYRDARYAQVIVGVDPDPANARARSHVGARLLGGAAPVLGRAAPT